MKSAVASVVGLVGFLFFQDAAQAGPLGGFGFQKVACADRKDMLEVAVEYSSGKSDGLIPGSCLLLPAGAIVLIEGEGIPVPGCTNVYIYRIHRVRHQHIVRKYYRYVAMRSDESPNPD